MVWILIQIVAAIWGIYLLTLGTGPFFISGTAILIGLALMIMVEEDGGTYHLDFPGTWEILGYICFLFGLGGSALLMWTKYNP